MLEYIIHHTCPSCGRSDLPMIDVGGGHVRCGDCRHTCPVEQVVGQSIRPAPVWGRAPDGD